MMNQQPIDTPSLGQRIARWWHGCIHQTAYGLAYCLWYVLSLLPFRVLYALSDALAWLIIHVVKYRHKVIWHNLQTSFPEKGEAELHQIERGFYHWFCDYLVETIKMMTLSRDQFLRRMQFTGLEEMNAELEQGRSVAIYLGHYGNWEWITSLPFWVTDRCQCCELYHPLENSAMDKLFKHVRERRNALCIPMAESLRKILSFSRDGRPVVVGYISDQVPLWWNIHHWLDFLHHDTPVLTGAERIVRHTRQAVYYGDMHRLRRGYYRCDFRRMPDEDWQEGEFAITDWYFRQLEATIRRDPAPYLWSHNRWKRTHEEFNRDWQVVKGKVIHK